MVPLELLSSDLQRLAKIHDYCEDISNTIGRFGDCFTIFNSDKDFQQSVAFCILQIGELAGKLTEDFRRSSSEKIPWHMIRGMRNTVVHGYSRIRLDVVWQIATTDIPALKEFCEEELAKARQE